MNRIIFQPNIPVTLCLQDPEGSFDFEGSQGTYQTTDGRTLVLPRVAVLKLNELEPKAGEEIGICRRVSKERTGGNTVQWDIWLTPKTENSRALQEQVTECATEAQEPPSEVPAPVDTPEPVEANLKPPTPIRKRRYKHPDPLQPRLFDRGTGTYGPAAIPVPAVARKGTPYPDMLRHIIRTVTTVLKETGEQWNDAAKQDLVSTVYIDCAKRSGVIYDFTEHAE
jgi:hypothetical protein